MTEFLFPLIKRDEVGEISDLETNNKTSVVAALNEVRGIAVAVNPPIHEDVVAAQLLLEQITEQVALAQQYLHQESYLHLQLTASDTWVIPHGLNRFPNITVMDSAGVQVWGALSYIDENNLIVHFSSQFAGRAYLS